jgi:hypothetical protein
VRLPAAEHQFLDGSRFILKLPHHPTRTSKPFRLIQSSKLPVLKTSQLSFCPPDFLPTRLPNRLGRRIPNLILTPFGVDVAKVNLVHSFLKSRFVSCQIVDCHIGRLACLSTDLYLTANGVPFATESRQSSANLVPPFPLGPLFRVARLNKTPKSIKNKIPYPVSSNRDSPSVCF